MSQLLDLSKPEIKRAYELGLRAGEVVANKAAVRERTRITRMLQALANDAKKRNHEVTAESYESLIRVIESEINIITVSTEERTAILNGQKF